MPFLPKAPPQGQLPAPARRSSRMAAHGCSPRSTAWPRWSGKPLNSGAKHDAHSGGMARPANPSQASSHHPQEFQPGRGCALSSRCHCDGPVAQTLLPKPGGALLLPKRPFQVGKSPLRVTSRNHGWLFALLVLAQLHPASSTRAGRGSQGGTDPPFDARIVLRGLAGTHLGSSGSAASVRASLPPSCCRGHRPWASS